MPALAVDDLSILYTSRTPVLAAVRDVSFSIEAGRCLGLVGESGSGKSSIGAAVQGLLTRQRSVRATGTVTIGGRPLSPSAEDGWSAVRGRQVTTVFQDPMSSLDPTMTVGRALGALTRNRQESERWLEEVEIHDPRAVLRSYPHQLSGGMRQRVVIALALARRPSVLIADEPTTALDVSVQAQVLRLLQRECERLECALLFITHDLGVARTMCDEVAVLQHGRVVEHGPAAQVFDAPEQDYTRRLMGSRLTLSSDRARPVGPPDETVVAAMTEALAERGLRDDTLATRWGSGDLSWAQFAPTAPAADPPVLELSDVRKSFPAARTLRGRTQVLHGIDLTLRPRESVAVVGESGSGKSTLLRVAAGLETADSGRVRRTGAAQVVFQDAGASLTPWRTVGQLLAERLQNAEPGAGRRSRAERSRLALERVALDPAVLDARVEELSGGQRQRVAIARAVVVPPAVLLCDEPTSALDVSVACSVLNLISLLRHELGLAVLFVTHDLAAARVIADRVVVVSAGRVVEDVPAETMGTDLNSDHGRRLLDAVLA